MRIQCGLSDAFHNKTNLTDKQSAYGCSFQPVTVDLTDWAAHVTGGGAYTPNYFDGLSRRKDTFVSGQMLALDLDSGLPSTSIPALLENPFIRHFAALLYPTPSSTDDHPKTRVVFVLDQEVTSVTRWEALQRGVLNHFDDLQPDSACKDAARLFYGSDKGGFHINLEARLPLALAGQLTASEAENEYIQRTVGDAPKARYTGNDQTYITRYLEAAINGELTLLASTPEGGNGKNNGRNDQTFKSGCNVFGFVKGGYLDKATAWSDLERAALQTGLPGHDVTRTLASAWKSATPRYVPEKTPPNPPNGSGGGKGGKPAPTIDERIHPVTTKSHFPADTTHNARYISDAIHLDTFTRPGAYLIKSPIGTGKTEAVKRAIDQLEAALGRKPKVLIASHRQALAEDTANRFEVECYTAFKDMPGVLGSVPQLAIVYNSLPKLLQGGKLPSYDLLIIDELEQLPGHLAGGTFQDGQATLVYQILSQLIQTTPRFVGLDAHLNITATWIRSLRADVVCIDNQYTPDRGALTIHERDTTVIDTALRLAHEGTIAIPAASKRQARKLEAFFKAVLGDDLVYMICGDNSESWEAQDFIANINTRLPELQVFIYTPSLGSGVDITAPVRAVCLIATGDHLPASELHQLLGRCRNVQETHAYIESHANHYETSGAALYTTDEQNAIQTGRACQFDAYGVLGITDDLKDLLQLTSNAAAAANVQRNDQLSHFAALATGYTLTYRQGQNEAIKDVLKDIQERLAETDKRETIAAEPVDYDQLEAHRQTGTLTPEVRYGHERYKIENVCGLTINEKVYDDLHTQAARQCLRRFTDLETPIHELRDSDQSEATARRPLSHRRNRVITRRLIEQAIQETFGRDGLENDTELSAEAITERLQDFITLWGDELRRVLGWRSDQSQHPVAILRWILGKVGIHLDSRQVMRDGKRFMLYRLNRGDVQKQTAYAIARRVHILKRQQENGITKNVDMYRNTRFWEWQPEAGKPPGNRLTGVLNPAGVTL